MNPTPVPKIHCTVCDGYYRRNHDGTVVVHGPIDNRCPGSRKS